MQLTKPVVAGITAGGIVIISLILLLFLYLTGFFSKPEDAKDQNGGGVSPELDKAVDSIKSYLGDARVEKALKTLAFEKAEDVEALEKWTEEKLPELKSDVTAVDKLFDAFSVAMRSLLGQRKKVEAGEKGGKEMAAFLALDTPLKALAKIVLKRYEVETYFFITRTVEELVDLCKTKPGLEQVARKVVDTFLLMEEFKLLDSTLDPDARRVAEFSRKKFRDIALQLLKV